jgi:hypothetical protein
LLVKRFFFWLNAAFAMAILDLISQVHLPSSVNKLPRYLKHFTFSSLTGISPLKATILQTLAVG